MGLTPVFSTRGVSLISGANRVFRFALLHRPTSLTKADVQRRIDIGPDIPLARGGAAKGDEMTESVGRSAWHGIEVRHLAALQALAEEASFHGAARRLGYSQPAVSQQLAALERIVGTQLVNRPRVSQPLTLTQAGKGLLVHARAVQSSLATAEAELGAGADKVQIRIGTFQTVSSLLLPHVVRELERRAAGVEIVLDNSPGDTRLVTALDRREIDASFVDLPLRFDGGMQTEPLAVDEYVLVVPRNGRRSTAGEAVHPLGLTRLHL